MSEVVICVENLSKHYRLGTIGGATLREDVQRWWAKLCGRPDPLAALNGQGKPDGRDHWALRDVSFEVNRGEVLGIIGRNGAGKSTILKILSRITAPTSGRAMVKGRIGSLLEVGSGFHPELTGRENIYLNGSILGMRKSEIGRKLDEIIDFSGLERFIDTPVKRYSSGMYVRLAFAVAAHLEPEILIIDEVLAVGDADFQDKCLGKMKGVAACGRTVLFVSHNLAAVGKLCPKSILVESGRVIEHGSTSEAIAKYLRRESNGRSVYLNENTCYKAPYFSKITISQRGVATASLRIDEPIQICFEIENDGIPDLTIGVQIYDVSGTCIHHLSDEFCNEFNYYGAKVRQCTLPSYSLAAGTYWIAASLGKRNYQLYERLDFALEFVVDFVGRLADQTVPDSWRGVTGPGLAQWHCNPI